MENLHSGKVGQNLPKTPVMPNFIEIGETTLEKSVKKLFTSFNILVFLGDPLSQRSPVWAFIHHHTRFHQNRSDGFSNIAVYYFSKDSCRLLSSIFWAHFRTTHRVLRGLYHYAKFDQNRCNIFGNMKV